MGSLVATRLSLSMVPSLRFSMRLLHSEVDNAPGLFSVSTWKRNLAEDAAHRTVSVPIIDSLKIRVKRLLRGKQVFVFAS